MRLFGFKLPSAAGFTVTEMAIGMGMLGLAALGAASMSGQMAGNSQNLQGTVAVNNFASSLNTHLYSRPGCEDLKIVGALSETPKEIALTLFEYQGMTKFEAGVHPGGQKKTMTKNFDIASLQAHFEDLTGAATIPAFGGETLTKSLVKIKAVLKVGNKPYEYTYNVPVLLSPSKSVKYCSNEKNIAETCAAAQGLYNGATGECELGSGCLIRDTINKLTCNPSNKGCSKLFGGDKNNKYTGNQNCPADSVKTMTQSLSWKHQVSCGKKCTSLVTNTMNWYTCLQCPP